MCIIDRTNWNQKQNTTNNKTTNNKTEHGAKTEANAHGILLAKAQGKIKTSQAVHSRIGITMDMVSLEIIQGREKPKYITE